MKEETTFSCAGCGQPLSEYDMPHTLEDCNRWKYKGIKEKNNSPHSGGADGVVTDKQLPHNSPKVTEFKDESPEDTNSPQDPKARLSQRISAEADTWNLSDWIFFDYKESGMDMIEAMWVKEFIRRDNENLDILESHLAHAECVTCWQKFQIYLKKKAELAGGKLV